MNIEKKKKIYNILTIIITICMAIFMCIYASAQSFWLDELDWTIDFIAKGSFLDMLNELIIKGFNLPLSYIIFYPIYKIAPFGEFWLLLPCIIAVLIGVIIIKKIGTKIGGEDLGFFAMCLAATSYVLIYQGAFELRPYAFLFCFSAWALYRFLCFLEDKSTKNLILYCISLILLAYTHWYGCLIIVFYFLYDLYLFIKKKNNLKFLIPYFVVGFSFLPWFILMLMNSTTNFTEYWPGVPGLKNLYFAISYLLSYNKINKLLFALGILIALINVIYKRRDKYKNLPLFLGSIIWVFSIIIVYSRFINPRGSLFVNRYFFVLLPHFFVISSLFLVELLNLNVIIKRKKINISLNNTKFIKKALTLIIIIIIGLVGYKNYVQVRIKVKEFYEPYRQVSNMISEEKNLYTNNSALLTSQGTGYLTYYFEKRGKDFPNFVYVGYKKIFLVVENRKMIGKTEKEYNDLLNYDTLYLFNIHDYFSTDLLDFINTNFEMISKDKNFEFYIYKKKIK